MRVGFGFEGVMLEEDLMAMGSVRGVWNDKKKRIKEVE